MLLGVVKTGFARGRIEFGHSLPLIFNYVFFPSVALVVMFFLRGVTVGSDGTSSTLGEYAIPGILAINVLFTGLMGLATTLITEREDGTLLRARVTPFGIPTYLIGKFASQVMLTVLTVAVILIEAAVLFGGFVSASPANIANMIWVLPLGMLATLPFGAVLGAAVRNPRNLSFISLFLMALVSISGVLYPLAEQASWMRVIGQSTPLYWLGLAFRGALLGDASAEIGGSWRLVDTALVLGAWSIVGALLAAIVVRRAALPRRGTRTRLSGPLSSIRLRKRIPRTGSGPAY